MFETVFPKLRLKWEWMNRLITAVFVTLTFSVFRSDSLKDAVLLWKKLFAAGWTGFLPAMSNTLCVPENYALVKFLEMVYPAGLNLLFMGCLFLLLFVSVKLICGRKAEEWIAQCGHTKAGTVCMAILFLWSFVSLSQVSVFLYFNF